MKTFEFNISTHPHLSNYSYANLALTNVFHFWLTIDNKTIFDLAFTVLFTNILRAKSLLPPNKNISHQYSSQFR